MPPIAPRARDPRREPLVPRAHTLSPADFVECPRCEAVLRRYEQGPGYSLQRCEYEFPIDHPMRRAGDRRCGQRLYVIGAGDRLAMAYAITYDEQIYLEAVPPQTARAGLEILRVIRRHDRPPVEERPCARCAQATKRYDLYAGVCRWCEHGTARPSEATP